MVPDTWERADLPHLSDLFPVGKASTPNNRENYDPNLSMVNTQNISTQQKETFSVDLGTKRKGENFSVVKEFGKMSKCFSRREPR